MEDSEAPSNGGSLVVLSGQSLNVSGDSTVFCYPDPLIHTTGIWSGANPLHSALPLLLLQVSITVSISRAIQLFLKPLKQPKVISEILGGIMVGPSFLGRYKLFSESLFPQRNTYIMETIAEMGLMYYIFLICIRVDMRLIGGRGRQPVIIGLCCMLLPFITVLTMLRVFRQILAKIIADGPFVWAISTCMSLSPLPVVYPVLKELRLLNSELGRISMSACMINDVAGWLSLIVLGAAKQYSISSERFMWFSFAVLVQGAVTAFMIRPVMRWIVRQTPEGKTVKHRFVVPILLGVLVMGFFSELMGASNIEGPMMLGLVVPDGPPLGSTLLERTETIVNTFLFPLFFCSFGLKTDLFAGGGQLSAIAALITVVLGCQAAKFVGTIAPSMYYGLPFRDSLVLSMIMSLKGVVQVVTYVQWFKYKVLDEKSYTILVMVIILTTSTLSPLVVYLTRNSQRFKPYDRRTIQHSMLKSGELRILTCIHTQDQVSGIIRLLDASHSNPHHTISLYLFHLVELLGRPSPILIAHHHNNHLFSPRSYHANNPIITAFKNYELSNEPGSVTLHAFTDISPYATMHEDICSVALDCNVSLIILPFHKQRSINDGFEVVDNALQMVNPRVVTEAPCSVGLLVDRCATTSVPMGFSSILHRVAAVFIGGPDDREVLSYAACMANNPKVRMTVVRFVPKEKHWRGTFRERQMDEGVVEEFRVRTVENREVVYREEWVRDGEDILSGIGRLDDEGHDLIMVGRSQGANSGLMEGLLMWSENPELGVTGDLLTNEDFSKGRVSVLVIQQQQAFGGGGVDVLGKN